MERFVKVGKFKMFLFTLTLGDCKDAVDVRHRAVDKFGSCILYTKNEKNCFVIKRKGNRWHAETRKLNKR